MREIAVQEAALVDTLVSEAFGYQAPHHFFQDFPVWSSSQARRFGIFSESELVSHAGIRVTTIGTSRVGLVGGVATHALHRAQGHSTKILEQIIEVGKSEKLDWLILWGSEHSFYSKFGFELSGIQTRVPVSEILARLKPEGRMPVQTGFTPRIFDQILLDQNRKLSNLQGVVLTEADRGWFSQHETVQWLWTADPFSYLGFERGMDLPHFVHEWGGDPTSLAHLFRQISVRDPVAEVLTHPSLLQALGLPNEVPQTLEHLCLAKPLSTSAEWPDAFWISGLNAC